MGEVIKLHGEDRKNFVQTVDSFVNFLTRTGIGAANLASGGHYQANQISRNRVELEWAYRGNWVARKAVDAIPEDMTREGVDLQCEDDDPQDLEDIEEEAKNLKVWPTLCTGLQWGRLYGGAKGFLMIAGQNPATPLRIETVGKGQFRGILPLDRWMVWPVTTDLITEESADFGKPKFYKLWPDIGTQLPVTMIHHSRLIHFPGAPIPYWQSIAENYWDLSVLEPIWDRMLAFDSTTQGAAQLVYKAHLRTVKVEGLRAAMASDRTAFEAIQLFFNSVRILQSNEGFTLIDGKDELQIDQYTFAGLAEMVLQFAQQIAGALDIPMVRFFAQSPAGMNATGESDWRNYYDGIKAKNENFRTSYELVYNLLYRSRLGREPRSALKLIFRPLWQLNDQESSELASKTVDSVTKLVDKMIYGRAQALKEIRAQSETTGFGAQITDDDIAQAEEDDKMARENPPQVDENGNPIDPAAALEGPGSEGDDGPAGQDGQSSFSLLTSDAVPFEESKHPPDKGKFSSKPGARGAGDKPGGESSEKFGPVVGHAKIGGRNLRVHNPYQHRMVSELVEKHQTTKEQREHFKSLSTEKLDEGVKILMEEGPDHPENQRVAKLMIDELSRRARKSDTPRATGHPSPKTPEQSKKIIAREVSSKLGIAKSKVKVNFDDQGEGISVEADGEMYHMAIGSDDEGFTFVSKKTGKRVEFDYPDDWNPE